MKNTHLFKGYLGILPLYLLSSVFIFYSCDNDVNSSIFTSHSKIWVDAVVKTTDTVKIYLGVTSGMNSGVTARYRDDATVQLFVNNSEIPKVLEYKELSLNKGYYYCPQLSGVKPGDSLTFVGWIEGEEFERVEAKTYIPAPVNIDKIKLIKRTLTGDSKEKIDLEMILDTSRIGKNLYFELDIKNYVYTYSTKVPTYIKKVGTKDDLGFSYGMYWNNSKESILVNYALIKNDNIPISFTIPANVIKNELEINIKTITKDYYEYSKAIENGSISKSNISNGTGIFTGYSESKNMIVIE